MSAKSHGPTGAHRRANRASGASSPGTLWSAPSAYVRVDFRGSADGGTTVRAHPPPSVTVIVTDTVERCRGELPGRLNRVVGRRGRVGLTKSDTIAPRLAVPGADTNPFASIAERGWPWSGDPQRVVPLMATTHDGASGVYNWISERS